MTLLMLNNTNTTCYKPFKATRTVFCLITLMVMCIAIIMPSRAFADLYTVEGVDVDVTAKNALEAREKAFQEAQLKAYKQLVERLASQGGAEENQALDAEAISFMVQDFEVTKEQLSAKRYKGTYTIRFDPDLFRQQVLKQGQRYSDIPRGAILVLPFYQTATTTILWDSGNPFLSAWARAQAGDNGLTSIVVPIGDIEDVGQVNEYSPLNYDPVKLERMRERYGANEVSIVLATPEAGMSGVGNLRLSLYSAKIRGPQFEGQMTIQGQAGETSAQLYDRAVAQLKQRFKADWKQETSVASAATQNFQAVMSFSSVREWIDVKQTLERVPGMVAVNVGRLTPREASVTLNYNGDLERLSLALSQSGLMLMQAANAYQPVYRIMRAAPQYQQAPSQQRPQQPVYQQAPSHREPSQYAPARQVPQGSTYNGSYYQ